MSAIEVIEKMYKDWSEEAQKDKIADVCYLVNRLTEEGILCVNPNEAERYVELNEDGEAVATFVFTITESVERKIQKVLDDSPFSVAGIHIETRKEEIKNDYDYDNTSGEEKLLRKLGFRIISKNKHRYAELFLEKYRRAIACLRFCERFDDC